MKRFLAIVLVLLAVVGSADAAGVRVVGTRGFGFNHGFGFNRGFGFGAGIGSCGYGAGLGYGAGGCGIGYGGLGYGYPVIATPFVQQVPVAVAPTVAAAPVAEAVAPAVAAAPVCASAGYGYGAPLLIGASPCYGSGLYGAGFGLGYGGFGFNRYGFNRFGFNGLNRGVGVHRITPTPVRSGLTIRR